MVEVEVVVEEMVEEMVCREQEGVVAAALLPQPHRRHDLATCLFRY